MNITFDQLFYGRGARGYGILGVSPGAAGLASRVEALCGSVGTPASGYGGEPFLLSVPDGDYVIMSCGRRGAPDSMGRATLFFHVLVALKANLSAAKADAFSLFAQGLFSDKMPQGEIAPARLDVDPSSARRSCGGTAVNVSVPCLFRSDGPLPALVEAVVGERTLDLAWATFAFQALPDFDVQVLPPRVQGPRTVNEYDASGDLVRGAVIPSAPRAEGRSDAPVRPRPQPRRPEVPDEPLPEKSNAMLKLSIAVNVILIALCVWAIASRSSAGRDDPRRPVQPETANPGGSGAPGPSAGERNAGIGEETMEAVRPEIERRAVDAYKARLSEKLSKVKELAVGDEKVIPGIADYKDSEKSVKDYFSAVEANINFVNTLRQELKKQ